MPVHPRASNLSRRELLIKAGVITGALTASRLMPGVALAQDAGGGTLTVGHIGDVDNYDPLTDALDQFQNYGRLLIFGSLTTYDADSKLIGDLATEWKLDGTAWVFTLRDGVTWHDGSPFTADDVKYTFERALDPAVGSFAVPSIGEDTTVEVVDPLTAKFNLPAVNASYPDLMTAVSIVKKDSGEANRDQPVGTGPFKFDSWSPNEQTVYVRNDTYYDPSRPLLDKIVFRPDPRSAGRDHEPHRRQRRSRLQPAHRAADGEDAGGAAGHPTDDGRSLDPARLRRTSSGKRVRWPTSGCGRGWRCASISTGSRISSTPAPARRATTSWPRSPGPTSTSRTTTTTRDKAPGPLRGSRLSGRLRRPTIDAIEGYPDLIQIASIWQDGLKKAGVNATPTTYEINHWLDRWYNGEYQISLNFDINGPDPQRMFVADYLFHAANGEWADADSPSRSRTARRRHRHHRPGGAQEDLRRSPDLLHDKLPVIPIYHPAMIAAVSTRVRASPSTARASTTSTPPPSCRSHPQKSPSPCAPMHYPQFG